MTTTEYWKSLSVEEKLDLMTNSRNSLQKRVTKLHEDCRILTLRLYGEDDDTFSPETKEVMNRWSPTVAEELRQFGGKR